MLVQKNVYSDLPMFISPNPFTGDISLKKDQTAIQHSVKNIILTAIGERPFDRLFGTDVYNTVFEHPELVEFYLESSINTSVNANEPRVRFDKITYDVNGKEININIEYFILGLDISDRVSITLQRTR